MCIPFPILRRRLHDAQNRLTTISGTGSLSYSNNGEEAADGKGDALQYDAWGQLVSWTQGSGSAAATVTYTYDGLGRESTRAFQTYPAGTVGQPLTTAYTYSVWDQILVEVTTSGSGSALPNEGDYVYAAHAGAGVDDLVLRDSFTTGGTGTGGGGDSGTDSVGGGGGDTDSVSLGGGVTFVGRAYVRQDGGGDVTSTDYGTSSSGGSTTWTTERYRMDPYGANVAVLDGSFGVKSGGTGWGWHVLHQGLFQDGASGLYYNRARWYDGTQGRFVTQDPSGWPDGPNGYASDMGNPEGHTDPSGLSAAGSSGGGGGAGGGGGFSTSDSEPDDDLVYIIGRDDQGPKDPYGSGEDMTYHWDGSAELGGDSDIFTTYRVRSHTSTGAIKGRKIGDIVVFGPDSAGKYIIIRLTKIGDPAQPDGSDDWETISGGTKQDAIADAIKEQEDRLRAYQEAVAAIAEALREGADIAGSIIMPGKAAITGTSASDQPVSGLTRVLDGAAVLAPVVKAAGVLKAAGGLDGTLAVIVGKILGHLLKRGWTEEEIAEAIEFGEQIAAINKANGNPAIRFIHPGTGKSVVVDTATGEIIHLGGPGMQYGPWSGDLP